MTSKNSTLGRRDILSNIGAIGGGVGLAATSGLTSASHGNRKNKSQEKRNGVSKRTAKKFAKKAVGYLGTLSEFEEWYSHGVHSSELFYAIEQTDTSIQYVPKAYVFPIKNRGDDVDSLLSTRHNENDQYLRTEKAKHHRNALRKQNDQQNPVGHLCMSGLSTMVG